MPTLLSLLDAIRAILLPRPTPVPVPVAVPVRRPRRDTR